MIGGIDAAPISKVRAMTLRGSKAEMKLAW